MTKLYALLFILSLPLLFISCDRDGRTNRSGEGRKPGLTEAYINTGRYLWQKPEMVLDLFGDLSNKTVADIGAGNGFFTFRLAEKAQKVIAIDISEEVVDYLSREMPENLKNKIEVRLVSPSSPQLVDGEASAVLIVNTYMYLDDRVAYLQKVHQGMASKGKLIINDFKKKQTSVGPAAAARVPLFEVEQELQQAGFRVVITDDTSLEYQYIVLAEKE